MNEYFQRMAVKYWENGWQPIPLERGKKYPTNNQWMNIRYLRKEDVEQAFAGNVNVGLILGKPSNHLAETDLDCKESVLLAPNFLPETGIKWGRPSKPLSHWAFVVKDAPRSVVFNDISIDGSPAKPLLEIRCDGHHQTMMPPSLHPEGETVQWYEFTVPTEISWEEYYRANCLLAAATLLAKHWNDFGSRHFLTLYLAGAFAKSGWTEVQTDYFLTAVMTAARDPEISDRRTAIRDTYVHLSEGDSVGGWSKLKEVCDVPDVFLTQIREWLGFKEEDRFPLNDTGNALRFYKHFGEDNKFCPEMDKWIMWDGQRWEVDPKDMIMSRTLAVQKIVLQEAISESDPERSKLIAKWAVTTGQAPRLISISTVAKGMPQFWIKADKIDANPWKLNVHNGTVDLRTGGLERPHNKFEYITHMAGTVYDPSAEAPRFMSFLNDVMAGNQDLIRFLQKLFGYSLTGTNDEQVFPIFYGTGKNGKSTLIEVIRWVMGDYCKNADPSTFLQSQNDKVRSDLARLRGARLVTAAEISANRRLDTAIVKAITGGEPITARHLFHNEFEYTPAFTVIMTTNFKPVIRGDDDGMWRRLRLVPFDVRIPDEKTDKDLKFKLRDKEMPGILAWMIQGCIMWQREGLGEPPAVVEATYSYREDSDIIRQFINECVSTEDPNAKCSSKALYGAYQTWTKANGERYASMNVFKDKLESFGFKTKRTSAGVTWDGLHLLMTEMEDDTVVQESKPNPFSV